LTLKDTLRAWSSSIEGSDKRRFFAVLHQPPITSAVDAVRAAIVAEQQGYGERSLASYINIRTTTLVKPTFPRRER